MKTNRLPFLMFTATIIWMIVGISWILGDYRDSEQFEWLLWVLIALTFVIAAAMTFSRRSHERKKNPW